MIVGVLRETAPGERRVAMVPQSVPPLAKAGLEVLVERGAGQTAGYPDAEYEAKGADLAGRDEVFAKADIVLMISGPGADAGAAQPGRLPQRPDGHRPCRIPWATPPARRPWPRPG